MQSDVKWVMPGKLLRALVKTAKARGVDPDRYIVAVVAIGHGKLERAPDWELRSCVGREEVADVLRD